MLLIFIFLIGGGAVKSEPVTLPENKLVYWEELVPVFEDGLADEYGERARKFAPWILEASHHYDVDPVILSRLIYKESSFRQQVVSRSGAVGPAQIKPRFWAKFCAIHDLSKPRDNIMCSAQILSHLEDKFGNMRRALQYYNAGVGYSRPSYVNYILEET